MSVDLHTMSISTNRMVKSVDEISDVFGFENVMPPGFAKGRDVKNEIKYLKQDLMDVVFDGAFRGVGDEEVVVREGVVVISSSLDMLTNNCLGGIIVRIKQKLQEKRYCKQWQKNRTQERKSTQIAGRKLSMVNKVKSQSI
ncbi:hypothetical protein Tco_1202629 [Tanacetum coccineum]